MLIYYIIINLTSIGIILAAYFGYDMAEIAQTCAQLWIRLLFLTLMVKPIMMILAKWAESRAKYKIVNLIRLLSCQGMKFRRAMGITTFLLLFIHGGVNMIAFSKMWYALPDQLKNISFLFSYIWLSLLLLGYITSNNFSVKILSTYWKTIQSVAYFALIFGVLHVVILNPAKFRPYLLFLIIYFYLKWVEKGKLPFFKL